MRGAIRVFSALVVAGLISTASAQQPTQNNAQPNPPAATNTAVGSTGWRVDCGNSGQALDCRTYIDTVDPGRHQVIASISVRYAADVKKPAVLLQIPLGILVTQPVAINVDSNPAENIAIETCTPQGCYAGSAISDAMIAKMRTGKDIKLVFYNVNKQPITLSIPLAGFAIAYDKIKG